MQNDDGARVFAFFFKRRDGYANGYVVFAGASDPVDMVVALVYVAIAARGGVVVGNQLRHKAQHFCNIAAQQLLVVYVQQL